MSIRDELKTYKKYIISISLTIALGVAGIFFGIVITTRHLVSDEILTRARAHFDNIVITREWNARFGGVYVEKKEGVISNPYLENPDIKAENGKLYTLKNPALMTREISEYAETKGLFKFHITSLNPVNPNNKPDEFETVALHAFQRGNKEAYQKEVRNDKAYFRFMAPLFVEKECLQCHGNQGYKIGDVRGGISVLIDMDDTQKSLKHNTIIISILGVVTIALLLGFIYLFTMTFIKKLKEARFKIETLAITDDLTGIFNRRHLITRFGEEFGRAKRLEKSLGCILIDIDRFKNVNDNFGHLIGDEALKGVAAHIRNAIRSYDILGRFGGEEFLIILPDTDLEEVRHFAERIRLDIKENFHVETGSSKNISMTASLGISEMWSDDISIDEIIRRADEGLYKAKNAGRDQVGWI